MLLLLVLELETVGDLDAAVDDDDVTDNAGVHAEDPPGPERPREQDETWRNAAVKNVDDDDAAPEVDERHQAAIAEHDHLGWGAVELAVPVLRAQRHRPVAPASGLGVEHVEDILPGLCVSRVESDDVVVAVLAVAAAGVGDAVAEQSDVVYRTEMGLEVPKSPDRRRAGGLVDEDVGFVEVEDVSGVAAHGGEDDEVGLGGDDAGLGGELRGALAGAPDAEVGDARRRRVDAEGDLELQAAAHGAARGGGVAAVGDEGHQVDQRGAPVSVVGGGGMVVAVGWENQGGVQEMLALQARPRHG